MLPSPAPALFFSRVLHVASNSSQPSRIPFQSALEQRDFTIVVLLMVLFAQPDNPVGVAVVFVVSQNVAQTADDTRAFPQAAFLDQRCRPLSDLRPNANERVFCLSALSDLPFGEKQEVVPARCGFVLFGTLEAAIVFAFPMQFAGANDTALGFASSNRRLDFPFYHMLYLLVTCSQTTPRIRVPARSSCRTVASPRSPALDLPVNNAISATSHSRLAAGGPVARRRAKAGSRQSARPKSSRWP